ncbi:MAG TPA: PTS sugar transporter subunit IIA [Treponemataceae bacterium]|nr:PTS sugar transporter subunit IIA [Treponemataceae bacterium]
MVLNNVFSPDLIKVGLEGTDKEEVFEELVDLYVSRNPSSSRSSILASLRAREEKQSTGIKAGFAFPHAQTEEVDSVVGIIGVSKSGIDYDSLDGKPVNVVFLLLSSCSGCSLHLRTLKRLSVLIEDPSFLRAIVDQKDGDGIYSTLKRYEDILATSM